MSQVSARPIAEPGVTYPSLVEELRAVGVSMTDIARATGVRERQVQYWLAGQSKPRDESRDRLVDIAYIARLLSETYKPEGVEIWFHARNPTLDGRRPIDLLAEGDVQPVVFAVQRLASGAM